MSVDGRGINRLTQNILRFKEYIGGRNMMTLFGFVAINLVYIIVCATSFSSGYFDWMRLRTADFWVNYALLTGLGIALFVLSIFYNKNKLKNKPFITDQYAELTIMKRYLDENCLSEDFKLYLAEENKKTKYRLYRARLKFYAEYGLFKKTRSVYKKKYDECTVESVEFVKFKWKDRLSYEGVFSGVNSNDEHIVRIRYSGNEGLAKSIVPTLMFSVFIQTVFLSLRFAVAEPTLDTFIQLAIKLVVMTTYLLRGLVFGDYSINTILHSRLENRKGVVTNFLAGKNRNIVIRENENYKFRAEEFVPQKETNNG